MQDHNQAPTPDQTPNRIADQTPDQTPDQAPNQAPDQTPGRKQHSPSSSALRAEAGRSARTRRGSRGASPKRRRRPTRRRAGPSKPRVRHPRYPLMNHPNPTQVEHFHAVAQTYVPDLDQPAAVEVLLVLVEVCHILDLPPVTMEQIFGANVLEALHTWADYIPTRQPHPGAQRAWVWMPGATRPLQARIGNDGAVRVSR